jgi:hypothetical protein
MHKLRGNGFVLGERHVHEQNAGASGGESTLALTPFQRSIFASASPSNVPITLLVA